MRYPGTARLATRHLVIAAGLGLVAGCGSMTGNGGGGGGPESDAIQPAPPSGDLQAGLAGQALPEPLRVVVKNGATPVAGKAVAWQITSGGGQVTPGAAATDADGIATATVTLPANGTQITITASADAANSPVGFTALVAQDAATVSVEGPPANRFNPQAVAIRAGGTVTFDYPNGSLEHNVLPDDGKAMPNQPIIRNGPFTFQVTFPTPGQYYYHCSVHGGVRAGMYGVVVVVP